MNLDGSFDQWRVVVQRLDEMCSAAMSRRHCQSSSKGSEYRLMWLGRSGRGRGERLSWPIGGELWKLGRGVSMMVPYVERHQHTLEELLASVFAEECIVVNWAGEVVDH